MRTRPRSLPIHFLRRVRFASSIPILVSLALAALCPTAMKTAAMEVALQWASPDPGPTIVLSGLEPGRYGIQTSTNLADWTELASGEATGGTFRHRQAEAPGRVAAFYRGVRLSTGPGIQVVPEVDPGSIAVSLVTPETGGVLTLTNRSGMRFTFTVGPSNVVATIPISMSLVSRFTSFPGGNSDRAAVVFSPDGFSFPGAGLLEIEYPNPLPALRFSSFAFDGNGNDLHLVPDLVSSNRVRIPVTHFSGVGTASWEPAGRATVSAASPGEARARFQHELGVALANQRQADLLSNGTETDIAAELVSRTEEYYRRQIEPRLEEAERNCTLAKALTREILGIDRQNQLLGWPDGPTAGFMGSARLEKWQCNCLQEAMDACEKGTTSDRTLVRTVLGIARETQLLGGSEDVLSSCGIGSLPEFLGAALDQKLPCLTEWIGLATYTDSGSTTSDCSNPATSYTCGERGSSAEQFEVEVDQVSKSEISTPFFTQETVTLTLRGDAKGAITQHKDEDQRFECGATTSTRWRTAGTDSSAVEVRINLNFLNGKLTTFTAAQMTALPVVLTTSHSIVKTRCGGEPDPAGSLTTVSFATHNLFAREVSLSQITFTQSGPTEVQGSAKGTKTGLNGVPQTFSWTFNLQRKR